MARLLLYCAGWTATAVQSGGTAVGEGPDSRVRPAVGDVPQGAAADGGVPAAPRRTGLAGGFSVFGYELTGSTGMLFLYGIIVGAAAVLGLIMLFTDARRRTSRHGSTERHELKQSRRETAAADNERHDLTGQRATGPTETANAPGNDSPQSDRLVEPHGGHRRRLHLFGHRAAPW